jgi:carboxylesterase
VIVGRRHTVRTGRLVGNADGAAMVVPGEAPCVLVIHGFTGTTCEIRPLAAALSDAGYAVHAPLLPGHGSTPDRLQDATWRDWRAAMAEELDAARHRYGKVVLCGFSLGSLLAMDLAADRPEGLAGLVVLGNAITLMPPVQAALSFVHRRGLRLPDWYLLKLWSSDLRDREARATIAAYDRDPLRAALEVYRAGRHVEERLAEIVCPVLIAHGAKDRVCPARNARYVADRVRSRQVTVRVYPRSAHLVAADLDRREVAADVLAFVRALP